MIEGFFFQLFYKFVHLLINELELSFMLKFVEKEKATRLQQQNFPTTSADTVDVCERVSKISKTRKRYFPIFLHKKICFD